VVYKSEKLKNNTMKTQRFEEVVKKQLKDCEKTLVVKGKEYVRNNDRFHNFNVGAMMTGKLREEVLYGFMLKHIISIQDITNDIKSGKLPSIEVLDEKFGDVINYLLLKKASIIDRIESK